MTLVLRDDDHEFELPIPIDDQLSEALAIHWQRIADTGDNMRMATRLATLISAALKDFLDPDLRAPTEAQIKYALAIAARLRISLPGEALRFRGEMGVFLTRHAEAFQARLKHQSTKAVSGDSEAE